MKSQCGSGDAGIWITPNIKEADISNEGVTDDKSNMRTIQSEMAL